MRSGQFWTAVNEVDWWMIVVKIPLEDVLIDVENELDLGTVSEEEAILQLTQAYSFLPAPLSVTIEDGIATISSPAESKQNRKTTRIRERATSEANRGRYAQAAKLYEQLLKKTPDDVLAHRNLGMALLEMGQVDEAERHLINALNLQPDDAYALLLLGNIYVQLRDREDIGERLYQKAAEADPEDPYILSNIAALMAERGEVEAAREYFDRAIAADASYPNAHYGKALSYYREGDLAATIAALEALFAQPESVDIRSEAFTNKHGCCTGRRTKSWRRRVTRPQWRRSGRGGTSWKQRGAWRLSWCMIQHLIYRRRRRSPGTGRTERAMWCATGKINRPLLRI